MPKDVDMRGAAALANSVNACVWVRGSGGVKACAIAPRLISEFNKVSVCLSGQELYGATIKTKVVFDESPIARPHTHASGISMID